MTSKEKALIKQVHTRLIQLGIAPSAIPFPVLREIIEGRCTLILARNLPCKACGQKHGINMGIAGNPLTPLTKLFPRKK